MSNDSSTQPIVEDAAEVPVEAESQKEVEEKQIDESAEGIAPAPCHDAVEAAESLSQVQDSAADVAMTQDGNKDSEDVTQTQQGIYIRFLV